MFRNIILNMYSFHFQVRLVIVIQYHTVCFPYQDPLAASHCQKVASIKHFSDLITGGGIEERSIPSPGIYTLKLPIICTYSLG